jgi:hypothetical protein
MVNGGSREGENLSMAAGSKQSTHSDEHPAERSGTRHKMPCLQSV